jgi:hypothetical protein
MVYFTEDGTIQPMGFIPACNNSIEIFGWYDK